MSSIMALRLIRTLIAAVFFAVVAASSPQVNFPLNSQLPPVARAGVAYSFQFATTTFQPDSDELQYSLINNPSWLSLNGATRMLSGTPSTSDIGTVAFTIAAAAEAGTVANMESRLVVVDHDAPQTTGNISQQLSYAGQLSGPKTVTLLPSKAFEVKFSSNLFQASGQSLTYYATLTDHTPLPAWISFDAPSLHFAGTTPPLTSSLPQSYEILLIASETPGFASASISFILAISDHQLVFRPVQQTISLAKGGHIDVSDLRGKLFLDNALIKDENITSATAELPSWLSFDSHTFSITGTPPSDIMSQDIKVIVKDLFGDTAKCSIHFLLESSLFTGQVGRLNITAGVDFDYSIPRPLLTKDNESVSMDFGGLAEWFRFDPAMLHISGKVPDDFAPREFQGVLTARSIDGNTKDTQTFELHVSGNGSNAYSGHTTTGQSAGYPSTKHDHDSNTRRAGIIVGAVLAPTFALAILLALVLLCRRKRQVQKVIVSPKSPRSPRGPRSPRKVDISRPMPLEDECEGVKAMDADLEKGDAEDNSVKSTPERPPRLDLHILPPTRRTTGHVAMTSIDESETQILTAFNHSDWGFKDEAGPSHHPHESMKIPTEMARRDSDNSSQPTKHRRRTTAIYRDRSSGLPVNRRLNSIGHGRHMRSPSRSNNNLSAYRRTMSSNSNDTWSTSILSTSYSAVAHPQPPSNRHTTQLTTPMEKRRSIRLVAGSTYESPVDRRPLEDQRKSYIRKRASTQSPTPFFGAPTSRISSSSYKSPPRPTNESEGYFGSDLSPLSAHRVGRPRDNIGPAPERELPDILKIRKPSETPTVESPPPQTFKDSLRKPPTVRSFTQRHTTAAMSNRDKTEGQYERPLTARYPPGRRSSTSYSLRAQELKSSINSLTGSKIFEDAETSESEYSQEEDDIEDYEKRTTIKAHEYLPPLNIQVVSKGKRDSKRNSKRNSTLATDRDSKRTSRRQLKRTSQREATPYSLAYEHDGKENASSTYNLGKHATLPSPSKAKGKGRATAASPSPIRERERPKTATGQRSAHPAYHTRTESRTTNQSSEPRYSQSRPISRQLSNRSRPLSRQLSNSSQTRHSRRSKHVQNHSRASTSKPAHRSHSRVQSCAFPPFDPSTLLPTRTSGPTGPSTSKQPEKDPEEPLEKEAEPTAPTPHLPRDISGNIANYGLSEIPRIEELDFRSIGIRTSAGRISNGARQSRLLRLHSGQGGFERSEGRNRDRDRDTTIGPKKKKVVASGNGDGILLDKEGGGGHVGLGLGLDVVSEPKETQSRSRTPLGVLDQGNGSQEAKRNGEVLKVGPVKSKAKRMESGEADGGKGRRAWGSLRAVVGRGAWGVEEKEKEKGMRQEQRESEDSVGKMFI